jgi:hypothetical protein
VVDLRQHPDPALRKAVDQVQLPQWPSPVQWSREDPRDLLAELRVGAGWGQRDLARVELEVEVGILHPVGGVEVERDLRQPPSKRRNQRQPLGDHALEVENRHRAAGRGGSIEDREASHMPVVTRVLEGEELLVQGGELAHRCSLPRSPRSVPVIVMSVHRASAPSRGG